MPEKVILILMVVMAFFSVITPRLRQAVIYMGIFSLLSSFIYLVYSAPDVAIAEAVIGSGIATVLYLVAIKRYRVFTIYFINDFKKYDVLLKSLENYLIKKELEPHIIYTHEDIQNILKNKAFDLVIEASEEILHVTGQAHDYHTEDLEKFLSGEEYQCFNILISKLEEGVIPNAQID